MRLDLFLKASRLVKRRSIAREMCENGRVLVNKREAKPAKEVKQGDIVTLAFSSRIIEVEITDPLSGSPRTISCRDLYSLKSDKRTAPESDQWDQNR